MTKESFAAWRLGFFTQRVQGFVDGGHDGAQAAVLAGRGSLREGDVPTDEDGGGEGDDEGEGEGGEGPAAAAGGGGKVEPKTPAEEAREAAMEEFETTARLPMPPTRE